MIKVKILKREITEAKRLAADLGALNNSITRGSGNLVGFIGELVTARIITAFRAPTRDYDIIKDTFTIDVKTKSTTVPPLPHYLCSVAAFNIHQQTDYYLFCRVDLENKLCYVLGKKRKDLYFKQATFCKAGEIDPDSDRNWCFKADCYNLPISALRPIKVA